MAKSNKLHHKTDSSDSTNIAIHESPVPSWLEVPPTSSVAPPVNTKKQELPFGDLEWENFEKLCLRLIRLTEEVDHCMLYGKRGDDQQGIDIFSRSSNNEKYNSYQCKREKNFPRSKIEAAVTKFLEGNWLEKTGRFVLCCQDDLTNADKIDALEEQRKVLKEKDIEFVWWDKIELSRILKEQPEIVDDFFGREWVKVFCGEEIAKSLSDRLDSGQVVEFREKYLAFYKNLIDVRDAGLPGDISLDGDDLSLKKRFVIPNIIEETTIAFSQRKEKKNKRNEGKSGEEENEASSESSLGGTSIINTNIDFESWVDGNSRSVILGDPGSGKSSLLRFLILDILDSNPQMEKIAKRWGGHLPVLVPFGLWTRLISEDRGGKSSLSDVLGVWLDSWDEGCLKPIVNKALKDNRLLLLVDGLDEWSDEASARIALDRLQLFIKQRDVPILLTSRPTGFTSLGIKRVGWAIGKIGHFDKEQQQKLIQNWFEFLYSGNKLVNINELVKAFYSDINKTPGLRDLAKNPLLLCILIFLRKKNISLPQNRFNVYESFIDYLISTHPKKRKSDATVSDEDSGDFNIDDKKSLLSYLAFEIHKNFSIGSIEITEACELLEKYLTDDTLGFGFNLRKSKQAAKDLLSIAENSLGLLVHKSPKEIGFFHRSLQEYLAANYVSSLEMEEQCQLINKYCLNPQWKELILDLFYQTKRPTELDTFFQVFDQKSCNTPERKILNLLKYEAVFHGINVNARQASNVLKSAFQDIETSYWAEYREKVLHLSLNGLRIPRLRDQIFERITFWQPSKSRWQTNLYEALETWKDSGDIREALFKATMDENVANQRAAATALIKISGKNQAVKKQFIDILINHPEVMTKAVAFEALVEGWHDSKEVNAFIEFYTNSKSPQLMLISILGKFKNKCHKQEDLDRLFGLGAWNGVGYEWKGLIGFLLQNGWKKSNEVKKRCLSALTTGRSDNAIEKDIALDVLLVSYPNDADVIDYCVSQIRTEEYPFLASHGREAWQIFPDSFERNEKLCDAIDEWLKKEQHDQIAISYACLYSKTRLAKQVLLSRVIEDPHYSFWYANALLKGWGMEDKEVRKTLSKLAFEKTEVASVLGEFIPEIIENNKKSLNRLIILLKDPQCSRTDFVMRGISKLDVTGREDEIVDAALFQLSLNKYHYDYGTKFVLITMFHGNEKVQKFALEEMSNREGVYSAVATIADEFHVIRKNVIKSLSPLPSKLRLIIAKNLANISGDTEREVSILSHYDLEGNDEVKCQMSISYHELILGKKQTGEISKAEQRLKEDIVCYGTDYEERRQAAFCGLIALRKLDLMLPITETIHDKKKPAPNCAISLGRSFNPNFVLLRYIAENWTYLKNIFGEDYRMRLSKLSSTNEEFWDRLSIFALQSEALSDDILNELRNRTSLNSENLLYLLSRKKPKSKLLFDHCLKTISDRSDQHLNRTEKVYAAIKLIVDHFPEQATLERALGMSKMENYSWDQIVLLYRGWSDSKLAQDHLAYLKKEKINLRYELYFEVATKVSSADTLFKAITSFIKQHDGTHQVYRSQIFLLLTSRMLKDFDFERQLFEKLMKTRNLEEFVTLFQILKHTQNFTEKFDELLLKKLNTTAAGVERIGSDLTTGNFVGKKSFLEEALLKKLIINLDSEVYSV